MPKQYAPDFADTPQPDDSWMEHGACRGIDNPELFFPVRGESAVIPCAICKDCPVQEECGEFAIAAGFDTGIWGGMGGSQRRRIRSQRRAA